jgi:nitrate/TMAO reductase-like tetraheme cytochrome c subunit
MAGDGWMREHHRAIGQSRHARGCWEGRRYWNPTLGLGTGDGRGTMKAERATSGRRIENLVSRISVHSIVTALGMAAVFLPLLHGSAQADDRSDGSCIACHQNPEFLVQNKLLYEYFRNWSSSVHSQEGVSCEDCHGGNPELAEKDAAHGKAISPENAASPVNFRNIAQMCGDCHDDILEGFSKSEHFQHIVAKKQQKQGPTCVTCHRSMNIEVLNVSSVRESCARCHNEAKHNHPENPEKAELILDRFLSIHRLYRYIAKNAEPEEAQAFLTAMDPRLHALSITWHSFDLEKIEQGTEEVLALLRAKRDELRQRSKSMTSNQAEQP